jgi:type IV secretory pathway protease TraF
LEKRSASEILIQLENKITTLLHLSHSQDLNLKILSNKLNAVIEILEKNHISLPENIESNSLSISTPESNSSVVVPLLVPEATNEPVGLRRTSRPSANASREDSVKLIAPQQNAEIILPSATTPTQEPQDLEFKDYNSDVKIPLMQRVVNDTGKSVFMADVEVFDDKKQSVFKTKTNAVGKWMASLPSGKYSVMLSKRDPSSKQKLESRQEIIVDESELPFNLPLLILK